MPGILKPTIIQSFQDSFTQNCLILFGEAFVQIKENLNINYDWEEENISANFFDYINNSIKAIGWNINITDEYRLYYNAILAGKKPAKSASRIDFRLTTNWMEQRKRLEFFVEAKNLIEADCYKTDRKTKLYARKLHERYIDTGIDNFVSGKYPEKGCLVGYILQGFSENIVSMINSCLSNRNRNNEQLIQIPNEIPNLDHCFHSNHEYMNIKHYFLEF